MMSQRWSCMPHRGSGLVTGLLLLLAACGGDDSAGTNPGTGTEPVAPAPAPVVSLSISPTTTQLQSGGSVTLQVTPSNTDIVWPTSVAGSFTTSGNSATYTPPAAAGRYEFTVVASADPAITAKASIEVIAAPDPVIISLSITPTTTQLESGDSLTFHVTAANTGVVWPVSVPGTLVANGSEATYTPPAAAGRYEITVAASENPAITATAVVNVFVPPAAEITAFSLPLPPMGAITAGAIDQTTGIISFSSTAWIDNLEALQARFTANGTVTVNGIAQTSGTANNFYRDVTYTVATGKFVQRNYTVRIKAPQTTGLPVIRIDTLNNEDIVSKDVYLKTNVSVVDADTPANSFAHTSYADEVKGRGNTTWNAPKKPYRLKFDKKTAMFGLVPAKSWVLLANYQDPTLMMNIIAFEMGKRFGLPFAHNYVPVELFLNGEYKGNYLLTEQNQTGAGRVDIDEDSGYFVELDTYYDEDPKFTTNTYQLPVMIKTPEDLADVSGYDFVKDSINGLETAMSDAGFPESGYRNLVDMPTFVDFIMINEIVGNDELAHPKSTYMYKNSDALGGRISMGPLWDFDWAFGYSCTGFQYYEVPGHVIGKHSFLGRFFQDPTFVSQYQARWQVMRPQVQSMPTFIHTMASRLQKSQEENYRLWPETMSNSNHYADEIANLVSWWQQRVDFLDDYILNGDMRVQPTTPYCN